jgi:hypothetical protein
MPKADLTKPAVQIDKRRNAALEKFFGLTDKVLKHISWSIEASKPCTACTFINGSYTPGKAKTADGMCAMCLNTGLVPDVSQRNWASGEIADRIAPKPKAVEMTVDKAEERKELEKEVGDLKDEVLDLQLQQLGVKFDDDVKAEG